MEPNPTATDQLGRVIASLERCLTPTAAQEILALQGDESTRRRLEELAAKCDAGILTPDERAEYTLLVEVGDLVFLLQTQARRFLAAHAAARGRHVCASSSGFDSQSGENTRLFNPRADS
jgi:hypothetical protein